MLVSFSQRNKSQGQGSIQVLSTTIRPLGGRKPVGREMEERAIHQSVLSREVQNKVCRKTVYDVMLHVITLSNIIFKILSGTHMLLYFTFREN